VLRVSVGNELPGNLEVESDSTILTGGIAQGGIGYAEGHGRERTEDFVIDIALMPKRWALVAPNGQGMSLPPKSASLAARVRSCKDRLGSHDGHPAGHGQICSKGIGQALRRSIGLPALEGFRRTACLDRTRHPNTQLFASANSWICRSPTEAGLLMSIHDG
jgi:hypothetical protein